MAIFPVLSIENIVQTNDTIRLDAMRSYVSKGESAITLIEIEPESGDGFIDVTGLKFTDWFLDWQYAGGTREVTVSVRVTTDGLPVVFSKDLKVITPLDDKLFSTDSDLIQHEEDILKFLPKGKTSFTSKHRRAQELIVEDFNERGVTDNSYGKLTKMSFLEIDEVKQWSIALTLGLIFEDNSNLVGDKFSLKAKDYYSAAAEHKNRAFYRIDLNNDGTITLGESSPYTTADLVRS